MRRLGECFATADRVDIRWVDADAPLGPGNWLEPHYAVDLGVDRVVLTDADVLTNPELRSALANNDRSRANELTVSPFDAEPLRLAITTVPRAANAFLVSHDYLSLDGDELGVDRRDRHPRQRLAMASPTPVPLLRLVLENDDFRTAKLLFDLCLDSCASHQWCADSGRAVAADHKYPV